MKSWAIRRFVLLLGLMTCLGVSFGTSLPAAAVSKTSVNVGYIFDEPFTSYPSCPAETTMGVSDTRGPGCGASIFVQALTGTALTSPGAYTTGDLSKTATFTNVPVSAVDAAGSAALAAFDTIVVYQVCDIGSHPATMTAINAFFTSGGKVLIYDGDRCATGVPSGGSANYSTFVFPFTTSNPGPRGAGGCYTSVESNTLTSGLAGYCDSTQVGGNDAVGDANAFVSFNGNWCGSITAKNALGVTGFIQAYARTPNGGLAIYEGEDNWFDFGPRSHQRLVFDNELKQNWSPDGLPCALPASGISLAPTSQTHSPGETATLTATVVDINGAPQAGVVVTFQITSGPNMAAHLGTDTGVTNGSGQTSVSYTSAVAGTDTWVASFKDTLGNTHTSNDATVTWADAPITAAGTSFSATEGQSTTATVAHVRDGDPNDKAAEYRATIDWGNGTPATAGTMTDTGPGAYDVSGTHTYADEGTYTVKVHIADSDSTNTADATSTANVADGTLMSSCAMPTTISPAYAGPTATFTDANPLATAADFTATINWGDGTTTTGTIVGSGTGPYTVNGVHTYATAGPFTVTTTIKDDGGSSTTATCGTNVPKCDDNGRENDGHGNMKDDNSSKHAGDNRDVRFNSDTDDDNDNKCIEQEQEENGETGDKDQKEIDSHDNRDGSDFKSTSIDSITLSQLGKKVTIIGSGVHSGTIVHFVVVEIDNGPSLPGFFSLQLDDGYSVAGSLIDGAINLS